MRILKKSDEKFVFTLKTTENLANALRRSVFEIPTVAIDVLEIAKNDSALYDETLAHRFGLLPIKMEKDVKEEDVLKFKIASKKQGYVYAKDIKGDFEVVYEDMPLTLLKEGQEVKISGKTRVGTGKEHSKFIPGLIFYRNACEIVLDKSLEEVIRKAFPENEVKVKGDKIIVKDDLEKSLVDFCEGLSERNKLNFEVKDTDELVFTIESFGQMKAEEIFKKANEVLKKELKEVVKNLK